MGRMKDFDIRIRTGGDDAIAAVSEYVSHLERKNALLERETALLRLDAGKDVEWHLSRLGILADEWEREFRARFPPSLYLDLVVASLRNAACELGYAVRRRLAAEEEFRWIPVTERLPDFGREVLIYWLPLDDNGLPACVGSDRRGGLIETAFRQRIDGEECWLAESGTDTVPTHWMPLPEPPAGTVAMLREQWQRLHTGPGPSPLVGIDQGEGESWTPQS
jgi:hypothetical protein